MTNRNLTQHAENTVANVLARLRGAQAARVVSYDRERQVVSLEFVLPVMVRKLGDDGEEQQEARLPPTMDEVPVAFPGTVLAGLTFNLQPGDEGAFVPWERDHSDYRVTGEPPSAVRNRERHTLGCGGYFIPMCIALANNVPDDADGATVVSGPLVYLADAIGAEAMARADRTNAQLRALADRLYFVESYLNQLQPLLGAAATLAGVPVPLWSPLNPPTGVPVGDWLGWNAAPRPWVPGQGTTPGGYAGTGDTAADRVRGV